MRWYFTISQPLYNKTLASYIDTYLRTTLKKSRSIVKHCHETIKFDFTQYVDSCFRHFLSDYLPLGSMIDAVFIYLVEGIKALYRMTYSITKIQKQHIKTIQDPR